MQVHEQGFRRRRRRISRERVSLPRAIVAVVGALFLFTYFFIQLQTQQCAALTHLRTNVSSLVRRGVKTVGDITPDSLLAARAVKPQPGESPDATHL